jgi:hypothetical protein
MSSAFSELADKFIRVNSETRKQWEHLHSLLSKAAILVFGAIPALFPAYLAAAGAGFVLNIAFGAHWQAVPGLAVLALWPAAGLYGVTALWLAAFGQTGRTVALGLIAGICAILPMSIGVLRQPHSDFLYNFAFLGPVATASIVLIHLVRAGALSRSGEKRFGDKNRDLAWVLFAGCLLGLALALIPKDRPDVSDRRTVGPAESPTTYPKLEEPVLVLADAGLIDFKLGSTVFRAPRRKVGFYVGKSGDEVDYTTLNAYVPELLERDSLPKRGDIVLISIQVRKETPYDALADCYAPLHLNTPMNREEAEAYLDCVFGNEEYRHDVDSDLGLFRMTYEGREIGVSYRRLDDHRRPNDGRIPFVRCSGTEYSHGWSCQSQGWIAPNINVSYQFYEKHLLDWPDIDAAVFDLIDSYRLDDSSDSAD